MKLNESLRDRIIRFFIGSLLLYIAFNFEGPFDFPEGVFALTVGIFGGFLFVTGLIGRCPIYAFLGASTYSPKE